MYVLSSFELLTSDIIIWFVLIEYANIFIQWQKVPFIWFSNTLRKIKKCIFLEFMWTILVSLLSKKHVLYVIFCTSVACIHFQIPQPSSSPLQSSHHSCHHTSIITVKSKGDNEAPLSYSTFVLQPTRPVPKNPHSTLTMFIHFHNSIRNTFLSLLLLIISYNFVYSLSFCLLLI